MRSGREESEMKRKIVVLISVVCLWTSVLAAAGDGNDVPAAQDARNEATLTHGFWGLNDALAGRGVEVTLGATNIYQANVRHGLDTHRKAGRLSGSYDLIVSTDLEKLAGLEGLGFFVHGEGAWPDTRGINDSMVGSAWGVNNDVRGDRPLDVTEAFVEWSLWNDRVTLLIGKMNFAGVFDTSEYANNETIQFLNVSLVNNPTIPFLDYFLGVAVTVHVTDAWYASAGIADAEGDPRETGFRTAFYGEDYFFYAIETGVHVEPMSLPGNYRTGVWYDPQPKSCTDSEREYRDDAGVYLSLDQLLFKESPAPEDTQGLAAFARYGYADGKRNDLTDFWSVGVQYQGLLETRDDDVIGLGFAQGLFTDNMSAPFTAHSEKALELYYSIAATPWMALTPDLQYLRHPGGDRSVPDAVVVGVRAQIAF
jgi:porin